MEVSQCRRRQMGIQMVPQWPWFVCPPQLKRTQLHVISSIRWWKTSSLLYSGTTPAQPIIRKASVLRTKMILNHMQWLGPLSDSPNPVGSCVSYRVQEAEEILHGEGRSVLKIHRGLDTPQVIWTDSDMWKRKRHYCSSFVMWCMMAVLWHHGKTYTTAFLSIWEWELFSYCTHTACKPTPLICDV